MFEGVATPFASAWSHFKKMLGVRGSSGLTLEDFRLELAELGLLGRGFGPEEYRAALEERLGIEISVEELPDAEGGALAGQLAAEGNLAEVIVNKEARKVLVLVRESLRYQPWPAYELSVFHELSHLAAGHPLKVERARGDGARRGLLRWPLAVGEPPAYDEGEEDLEGLVEKVFEPEARKRAKWLVLAGTCPAVLETYKLNQFT